MERTSMLPSRTEFTASYDRTTKIISAVACAVLILAGVLTQNTLVVCVSALTVLLSYAYSPRGYALRERSIVVRRLIGGARIPLDRVREARRTTSDDLRGCIRLWGSGGMFGYYGLFRTSKLKKCWWYVTDRQNTVVVVTDEKTALFSPDDGDGFLAAIRATVPVPETPVGQLEIRTTGVSAGTWIGIAIGALSLAIVAFAFLYSPGPPSYTLTADALAIHDRFYPVTLRAADVDVARVRLVDIAVDREWRPTMRTNGFANAHYRSGWFRVANGQKVRMYRADGTRLVLLPPNGDGAAVLLEVRDPGQFLDKLRRAWGNRSLTVAAQFGTGSAATAPAGARSGT
jgi:hypothetical protein